MNVLITGGTGMVGQKLVEALEANGHQVRIVSRKSTNPAKHIYHWNVAENYVDEAVFKNLDVIVHLAGASVADKRWTAERKKEIIASRIDAANLLMQKLQTRNQKLLRFITASGTGYYGNRPFEKLSEDSSKGSGFLSDVCAAWEDAASNFSQVEAEVYINRIGIVLDSNGGFIGKMRPLFKWHIGAALGSGKQVMSWIHIDDLVHVLTLQVEGRLNAQTYNAVAPQAETHVRVMKLLAKKFNRKIWLPNVPTFALKIMLGELSSELVASQDALPTQLMAQNFEYKYPVIDNAINSLAV